MAIQWYPGHMHKAKKAIIERLKSVDMVIEVLDARMPASSENPLLGKLSSDKPKLKILNKQDLADPERTALWLAEFQSRPNTNAIALDASDRQAAQKLIAACRALVPNRKGVEKPLRVMICGIPNVGKSTLINGMLGKKSAKTGNEPGITKAEQRLFLADDFWLYDTPGMLWPKIIVPQSGYNLAASGAVGRNALFKVRHLRAQNIAGGIQHPGEGVEHPGPQAVQLRPQVKQRNSHDLARKKVKSRLQTDPRLPQRRHRPENPECPAGPFPVAAGVFSAGWP